jgi:putative redox protein
VSAGLGACTAMTLRLYAKQKEWPLSRVHVRVCHSKDKARSPQDRFLRTIQIEGELDAAQHARLLEIADRCPVHRTLEAGSAVDTIVVDLMPASPEDQHLRDMEASCAAP